jgi:acyl-homoserine lactone acylase PvdQ
MAPDPENFRGIHAVRVLTGVSDLTLDGLIALAYDPELPGFEKMIPGLIGAYDGLDENPENLREAIDVLRDWDLRVSVDSVAMTLAHFYGIALYEKGSLNAELANASFVEKISALSEIAAGEQLAIFTETLEMLTRDFGTWNIRWGEVNRYQRLTGDIQQPFDDDAPSLPIGMASGNWGALASFKAKRFGDTKRIYGTAGNSFVAAVEFGDRVRAKSMLAGGQSGDPTSPHFDDQTTRYANREFKDVAFYREDVDARASSRYQPGL